jgi:two-component system response regulator AtoC
MVFSTETESPHTIEINLPPPDVIFGTTAAMKIVRLKLERAAGRNIPVLIRGESGTGKEVIAKLLHHLSPWKHGPFVKVNCPAIPGTLMESELFGYERGAFTGAYASKPGKVESARAGTLFLDEIGDLETNLQAKLLQVLQDGRFCRIGGEAEQHVDVRIVSATNHNLEENIAAGSFREDLLYRLDGVTISLPPLRERRSDIPRIVEFLIEHHSEHLNCMARPLSSSAMQALMDYPWYGNIRELENVVRRYVIFGQEDAVLADLTRGNAPFFAVTTSFDGDFSLKRITRQTVQDLERRLILQVLASNNWNRKKAARVLKISYRSLMYKIREMNIPPLRVKDAQQAGPI